MPFFLLAAHVKMIADIFKHKIQDSILEAAVDGIIVINQKGLITEFNPAAEKIFALPRDQILGHNIARLMPRSDASRHDQYMQSHLASGTTSIIGVGREVRGLRADGVEFPMHLSVGRFEHQGETFFVGICHDLSSYYALQADKTRAETRLQQLSRHQSEYLCHFDANFRLLSANEKLTKLLGLRNIAAHRFDLMEFVHEDDKSSLQLRLERFLANQDETLSVGRNRLYSPLYKQPRWFRWEWYVVATDHAGNISEIQARGTDITEQVNSEEKAFFLATHDPLTGLWNRLQAEETLNNLVQQKGNSLQPELAVVLLDIDRFKYINNSMSYHLGDDILREVGYRLQAVSDEANCHVARWGGDEFMLLFRGPGSAQRTRKKLSQIIATLQLPIQAAERNIELSYSAGISLYPADATDTRGLLAYADNAKHNAKQLGGNRISFYDQASSRDAQHQFDIEQALRPALNQQQLQVFWQPKFRLPTRAIVSFEALLRWPHADYGWISPAEFVPVAEALGLDAELGKYVIARVIEQQQQCITQGLTPLPVAINISAQHIAHRDFATNTLRMLEAAKLDVSCLAIEITETAILHIDDKLVENVCTLRDAGIAVSIDDFGTGYSSLRSLARLRLSALKIDKEFVDSLSADDDHEGQAVLAAMITLGRSLGLELIAEGIETPEQAEKLAALGCDTGQGYLVSPAVPFIKAQRWLRER